MSQNPKNIIIKAITNPQGAINRVQNNIKDYLEESRHILSLRPSASTLINQKEIRIVGLMRTGNHAITNWIRKQQRGSINYLNNIPCDKNPYQHFYERHLTYNKYPRTIRKLKRQAQGKLVAHDCLIYSHEDYSLEQVTDPEFEKNHDLYMGKSGERYDVLIIRDPFNLIASRFKSGFIDVKTPNRTAIDLWIAYAQEYLGETNYLKYNKICVNYNQWTMDVEYRKSIAQQLGLEFSDAGFNEVKAQGGGSSFEGQKFDGQASKMDVHNRWKVYQDNEVYRQMLNQDRVFEYSEKIFGRITGVEALRSS